VNEENVGEADSQEQCAAPPGLRRSRTEATKAGESWNRLQQRSPSFLILLLSVLGFMPSKPRRYWASQPSLRTPSEPVEYAGRCHPGSDLIGAFVPVLDRPVLRSLTSLLSDHQGNA